MIHAPSALDPRFPALKRVLAIDPISRGFGFVVLEGPDRLIDWGVVHVRNAKHKGCLSRIGQLIDQYIPDTLVTEDVTASGSRRGARVRNLVEAIQILAKEKRVACRKVSRQGVRRAYSGSGAQTKHQIASVIADRFPELRSRLPRPRKCYESADDRMAIFDAASFALALMRDIL